ncbi:MAG: response regulator [Nitrospina sp.]|jgi:CheY-like chemotaxis protein|nr:response regulator [Nitrospina sp.]MBT6717802.1 response regulator [Nitrospina sp.]
MTTVLVIEDNADNMEIITALLGNAGYQIFTAMTGMEGLEMAIAKRPDFILLDILMPDINGDEVLQKLRATEEGKDVPVIAVTSCAMIGDRARLLAAGCNGYIEKPIDPMTIITQIREILGETQ